MTDFIPAHKWTDGEDRVHLLKCVNQDRTSYGGFVWPEKGPVTPAKWSRDADCESGGLFGWPWGLGVGGGKGPDYGGLWIVFAAHPDDVIDLGDKAKAVPDPEAGRTPEVVYCGSYVEAMRRLVSGQIRWVQQAARGAASATGWSGAASATGERGAASATGERGAASATGGMGAASATGERSIAAATGHLSAVRAGDNGACVCTADECWWHVTAGAVFLHRWAGGFRCLTAADIGAADGDRVRLVKGEVAETLKAK